MKYKSDKWIESTKSREIFFSFIGYGFTSVALLLAATTILNEKDKLPLTGGVLPPGAAFAKTNYISNLSKNGVDFEVISATETTEE